jgi:hypothetical protein
MIPSNTRARLFRKGKNGPLWKEVQKKRLNLLPSSIVWVFGTASRVKMNAKNGALDAR